MKYIIALLMSIGVSLMAKADETWSVGEARIQGKPVVYKFMNKLPNKELRDKMVWLTVVSWQYDGSINNGMPPKEVNEAMIRLEDGLETINGRGRLYFDVYSATGNNLKEFVFYIVDREEFMSNLNQALRQHEVYPLEINFYEDKGWSDLVKLHTYFGVVANKSR
ncbi:MAG: DUF695 domain-containing protein [Cellvibrionaceae bacterium]|nr:DUF695 domain-containing protein [Cellvibrionaceae bacterium]